MTKKWILGIGYCYVWLPTVIFFVGWVKSWIAVPLCLLLGWSFLTALKADVDLYLPDWNRGNIIRGIVILCIIAVWVYFSGIGNFVWQNSDYMARNALYEILVGNDWPVVRYIAWNDGTQLRGLIYYIGYWLPAAAAGKMFGVGAGYLFQYFWAVLGISISVVFLNSFLKKWAVWPLVLFIMFSGLDALGCVLSGNGDLVFSFRHIEWWNRLQFSGFTTQLFWVFNQAIYAWVIFALLMIQKSNGHILCIWSLGMLVCTFPTVGMIPFVVYKVLQNGKIDCVGHTDKKIRMVKRLLSLENIVGGAAAVVCFFYLAGNRSAQNSGLAASAVSGMQDGQDTVSQLIGYIMFLLIEIGIYYCYIYRYYKKDWLFYVSMATLLVCPLIKVGSGSDFCMRASIPSLLAMYYMVADSLRQDMVKKTGYCFVIIIILAIGSINTVHEIGRSVMKTTQLYQQHHRVTNAVTSEEKILKSNNFSGNIEDNPFFRYLAK